MKKKPSSLKPEESQDSIWRAYTGIRNMLFHNEIMPGQKIAYRDLAERLGMSQTPVIQALKWLEFQQIVRREPNRGYYTEPLSLKQIAEIYEFRELIELSLLPKAMGRMDADGLARLQKALAAHRQAAKDPYLHERLIKDMTLHLTLAELSDCAVQERALRNLYDLLYLKYGLNILFSAPVDTACDDHAVLVDRIGAGDVKGARQILSRHIRKVKKHVLAGLERRLKSRKTNSL